MALVYGSPLKQGKLWRVYIVERGYIRDPASKNKSTLPQLATTRSTGNTSVRTQKVNHSNTRGLVSSLFFSRSEITAALSLHFQHLYED